MRAREARPSGRHGSGIERAAKHPGSERLAARLECLQEFRDRSRRRGGGFRLKIQTNGGEIIDLAELRKSLSYRSTGRPIMECLGAMRESLIVLDALQAVLSMEPATPFNADYVGGYNTALDDMHQEAGLVEETA